MAGSVLTKASGGRALIAKGLVLALTSALGCAGARATSNKYPRRGAGCEIALSHTAVPGVALWDDIGVAEASCHVNLSLSQCLQLLKAEAFRMGGDIIYNVPREPLRPQDQVLLFRGQVAHSLPGLPKKESDEADLPPPASKEESAGPVVPLTAAAAPAAAATETTDAAAPSPAPPPSPPPKAP
jgi:hypothetical protein